MKAANTMQATVGRYLDERRQLGFDLKSFGRQLMRFARFADARGHRGPLTLDLQLDWAREHVLRTGPRTAERRLEIVRPFAAYYRQYEEATEVPERGLLGRGHWRPAPHIYTTQEVLELLDHAGHLSPRGGLRPWTYRTLFGLLAAVGLRVSEALNLLVGDVDLQGATVTVRRTKFNKSRCLPVHQSAVQALAEYRHMRDRFAACTADAPFFVSPSGEALPLRTVENVFSRMRNHMQWHARGDYPHPRLQDLRHNSGCRIIPGAWSVVVRMWRRCSAVVEGAS